MIQAARTIWAFSRPHTVIGSVISIVTLYCIIYEGQPAADIPLLCAALATGICCNVFIVGLNQIADVQIDRINKPYLPVAAGLLSMRQARLIVYGSLLVSLACALLISPWLFYIVLLSAAIGWAYSMPPFHWKKHHLTAAVSIVFVRGVLINIGGFLAINHEVSGVVELPGDVGLLAVFMIVFSLVISWFKDLPDIAGDSAYRIRTLAIVSSPAFVLIAGHAIVIAVFAATILLHAAETAGNAYPDTRGAILFYGNIGLLLLFIAHSLTIDLSRQRSLQQFYKRFWGFFFAEYLLYLGAYLFG